MKIKKILNGIAALILVAAILLFSDLSNRVVARKGNDLVPGKLFRFCFVHYVDSPNSEDVERGVRDELKNKGLIEGKNFTIKIFNAQGDISTLNSITGAISSETWDLIFASSTPTVQSLSKKINNTPIVFSNVGDPIRAGLGESFEKHNPILTGISTMSDFDGLVKLVKETIPGIKIIGTLYSPGEINSVAYKEELEKAARKQGLTLIAIPANSSSEVADATTAIINRGIQAFTQISDNLTGSCGSSIIKIAYDYKMPYFSYVGSQLSQGAIAVVSRDYYYSGIEAVDKAIEILKGKSPENIPFSYVSKSLVKVNTDAMHHFNLKVPDKYLTSPNGSTDNKGKGKFNTPVRMAMVHYVSSPDCDDVAKGILARLKELGHIKDDDFKFDVYNANADIATLNNMVQTVKEKKYDLIFSTVLVATQALAEKITDVPILFTVVADPVGNGLGKSYEDHRPNLTGIDGMSYTDAGIELLLKYLPNAKNIGVLFCPGEMASVSGLKELKKSCKKYNLNLISVPVNAVSEVTDATTMLCAKKIDAISQMPDNCTIPSFSSMVKVTQKQKIPLFAYISSQVEMGAIAAIAGDYFQQGREITDVGMEVLNGKSPNDIPFSRIKQIKTVINPKAATQYGLETPKKLLNSDVQPIK
ncbi:MAG TPA: ABC transporter substrate-binding protein [Prolixibacteraceae bacterium]|nr:ABC transporter substrate-binding protein [Prolixibacteraceae bacterium]HPS13505.1 ABC transporter substrate-binding protein [Prolixibacteraceae bacterium]